MTVVARDPAARMSAIRERVRLLRMQVSGPVATTTTTTPTPRPVDLTGMVRDLTQIVESVEETWNDARAAVDNGSMWDYQVVGEGLQDLFANVFTGFVIIAGAYGKAAVDTAAEARPSLLGLADRMRQLVDALDRTWPWLNIQPGLFDPADLRAAVEEYRRGEFADLKEFARGVAGTDQ